MRKKSPSRSNEKITPGVPMVFPPKMQASRINPSQNNCETNVNANSETIKALRIPLPIESFDKNAKMSMIMSNIPEITPA